MFLGKPKTNSNRAWHRPMSEIFRLDEELVTKSTRALPSATDPLERLRLMCLSRGTDGIITLGRIFRKMYDGRKQLNKEEFLNGIKKTGVELRDEEIDELFNRFDTENSGLMNLDEFLTEIRPPMSDSRRTIVEKAFRKFDKAGDGLITVDDIRRVYCVTAHPRYMSGEESEEVILDEFLAHFETDGIIDGKVTLEEFVNYYSTIGAAIDNDGYFDLMMRKAYKL